MQKGTRHLADLLPGDAMFIIAVLHIGYARNQAPTFVPVSYEDGDVVVCPF